MAAYRILLLPGDGIGPEVMEETRRVLGWLARNRNLAFDIEQDLVGGAAYDRAGDPAPDAMMAKARAADAVLFGAVGGPKWETLPFAKRPERGLLRLRKDLDLFANLRPALCFEALKDASTLKPEIVAGLDILIVRELTGGVYFGEPRGIETLPDGTRRGVDTQLYTTGEIRRIARVAFELARLRGRRVASAEKSNVMHTGILWREEVQKVRDEEFADVALTHILADNCAMQLVRNPKQFDVIVTDNLFGDILSDEAAQLTGSIGMLPSASLGARGADGRQPALYEPIHGSAPDIAGPGRRQPHRLSALARHVPALFLRPRRGCGADRERRRARARRGRPHRRHRPARNHEGRDRRDDGRGAEGARRAERIGAGMVFAIKAEIRDPRAKTFAFAAQKTMYGGKHIAPGDTIFLFASENEGGQGLVARGIVTSAEAVARKRGIARQTPRVGIAVRRTALAKRPPGRSALKPFADWKDGRPETELNFKFYRQATNKIVGLSDETAAFLDGFF